MRGTWTTRDLETFALRHNGTTSAVLVNKLAGETVRVRVVLPGCRTASLYQYSSTRLSDAVYPLATMEDGAGEFEAVCPAYSVTVLKSGP